MEPNWKPLKDHLGEEQCTGFMYMGRVNGINLYKHGIARMYLDLDDRGQCYVCLEKWRFEKADFDARLAKLEAALAELGETLESIYDESYITRKKEALEVAGISHERVEIQPEDLSINSPSSFVRSVLQASTSLSRIATRNPSLELRITGSREVP